MAKMWCGTVPKVDDLGVEIGDTFIDGATTFGPWALMAPETFARIGRGLGQGKGQKYQRDTEGRWIKVEG